MSDNIDKQTPKTKEYYANYPGFRITSGIKIPDGDLKGKYTDFSVMTDEIQGIAFYKDGLQKLVTNGTSYETVGMKVDEGDFAKIISAPNGNILIEAKAGDIEIRARNIRLHATNDPDGEMTIKATKHIYTKAPIIDIDGNLTNVLSSSTIFLGLSSTNLPNSSNCCLVAFIPFSSVNKLRPFLSHTQQCHNDLTIFTSSLGL